MDERIKRLAAKQIYLGTSSWKYEGWAGLVYRRTYPSAKAFQENSLQEYAEHFSAVGLDHTYYAWPNPSTFEKYFELTPEDFRFGLKATERTTIFQYPKLKRYGKYSGMRNETFLNPEVFLESFIEPLQPFKNRLAPIMLEFSQFYPGMIGSGGEFLSRLSAFLQALTSHAEGFQFGVELRNANWVQPAYFEMLAEYGVAHVFNSWTRMPTIGTQLEIASNMKLTALMSRVLLNPGVKYAEAVEAFAPYDRVQAEHPNVRQDCVQLIKRALEQGIPAFIFVNNRCEGCAPKTIEGILDLLAPF